MTFSSCIKEIAVSFFSVSRSSYFSSLCYCIFCVRRMREELNYALFAFYLLFFSYIHYL